MAPAVPAGSAQVLDCCHRPGKVMPKAVTARRPRTRNPIGRDAALLTWLARVLPDRTLDCVFAAALRPPLGVESKI